MSPPSCVAPRISPPAAPPPLSSAHYSARSAATESTNVFGFVVDDVDKVAAGLTQAGVRLETEPVTEVFGQRHFFVRDPAGTWLDVIQFVEPDPEWVAADTPTT